MSGKKEESTVIKFSYGPRKLWVVQLPGEKSMDDFFRLVNVAGPGLVQLLLGGLKAKLLDKLDANSTREQIATELLTSVDPRAVSGIFALLKPDEMRYFREALLYGNAWIEVENRNNKRLERTEIDSGLFDTVFQGEIGAFLQAIVFAAQVNWRSFTSALVGVGIRAATGAKSQSGSETSSTSNGPSNG